MQECAQQTPQEPRGPGSGRRERHLGQKPQPSSDSQGHLHGCSPPAVQHHWLCLLPEAWPSGDSPSPEPVWAPDRPPPGAPDRQQTSAREAAACVPVTFGPWDTSCRPGSSARGLWRERKCHHVSRGARRGQLCTPRPRAHALHTQSPPGFCHGSSASPRASPEPEAAGMPAAMRPRGMKRRAASAGCSEAENTGFHCWPVFPIGHGVGPAWTGAFLVSCEAGHFAFDTN